jgi:cytochrome d ubiquinol oxidase subunit II
MLEPLFLALLALALALYAVLGGADFGGGILDLTARGPLAARQRAAIAHAIGPVWEANHVWLIFAIVLAFTAFPAAFAAANEALYLPFSLALVGIVFRGAAFAFRAYGEGAPGFRRAPGYVFGLASLLAPLFLGAAAGALAAGRIRLDGSHALEPPFAAWTGPLSLVAAGLAVCASAYLAGVYLCVEAVQADDPELEAAFRRRALAAGAILSALAPLGLLVAKGAAPIVFSGLLGRALPLALLSALAGAGSIAALWRRRYRSARALAAIAVASVLGAWVLAQWPYLVVPDFTVASCAAPAPILRALLVTIVIGATLLIPSLALLFRIFSRPR